MDEGWEIVEGTCVQILATPGNWHACAEACRDLGLFTQLLTLDNYNETVWGDFVDSEGQEVVWIGVAQFSVGNINFYSASETC